MERQRVWLDPEAEAGGLGWWEGWRWGHWELVKVQVEMMSLCYHGQEGWKPLDIRLLLIYR